MEEAELIKVRGHVVHEFARVEAVLDAVVAIGLFRGAPSEVFLADVASNEHYSWALRLSVFLRIVQRDDWGGDWPDEKQVSNLENALRRLATLRNLFAHAGRERVVDGVRAYVDPKNSERPLDFSALDKEFQDKVEAVWSVLEPLYKKAAEKYQNRDVRWE